MIYDSERHQPLIETPWSPDRALQVVREVYVETLKAMQPSGLWKADPNEETKIDCNKSLYNGATGVVWGLNEMSERLGIELPFDIVRRSHEIHEAYLADPDSGDVVPSYFLGESSILLLRQKLGSTVEVKEQLRASISANTNNPVNEALWGSPGTMVAAIRAGEVDLYLSSAEYLFSQWYQSPAGYWLWRQDLYGEMRELIGAAHGFFGNVYGILEGQEYLTENQRNLLYARTVETTLHTAIRCDGMANWTPRFTELKPRLPITQWCHGSPGVITSLRSFPKNYSSEMENLLLEAGASVWAAGPLKKGIGLCHGTDGNGFALLRMFDRTGDELWLYRARGNLL